MHKKFYWMITLWMILALLIPASPVFAAAGDITGTITGVSSTTVVTIAATSAGHADCTVNVTGNKTFTLTGCDQGFAYTVVPTATGFVFTPLSSIVTTGADSVNAGTFKAVKAKFSISGTITAGTPAVGLAGVRVTFGRFRTTTAADGTYTITGVPYNAKGILIPVLKGYAFEPASINLTVTENQTGKDFVGAKAYTIAGRITWNGKGLKGVTLTLGTHTTTTLASGVFIFKNIPEGLTGELIPSLDGFTFTPASITIAAVTANLTAQNFTATAPVFTISGRVVADNPAGALQGVTVTFKPSARGSTALTTTTNADGFYTFTDVPYGTRGRLSAAAGGYKITPSVIIVPYLTGNIDNADFHARLLGVSISGKVIANGKPLAGVKVSLTASGQDIPVFSTNKSGTFKFTGLLPGVDYTISFEALGYTFVPNNQVFTALNSNETLTVVATLQMKTISGTITGLAPTDTVQVWYGVKNNQYVMTEAGTGKYTLPALPANLTYVVLPFSESYVFTPIYRVVSAGIGDVTGIDFVAAPAVIMSGRVTVQGKPVKGVTIHAGDYSEVTDANGMYSLLVPAGVTFTPTAEHRLFIFAPAAPVTPTADFTQDWTTATVVVTGMVTEAPIGTPMGGVTLKAGTATAITGADGTYELTVTDTDVPNLASFSVKPQPLAGFTFKPGVQPVNMGKGANHKDFTAMRQTYSVSGRVTLDGKGLGGAIIRFGGLKATSNSSGFYTLKDIPFGTNVTLSILKYGYTFSTVDVFVMPGANVTGKDFTARSLPGGRKISGSITLAGTTTPLAGVKMVLTWEGLPLFTTTTDKNGAYTFSNLAATGGYLLQPVKASYIFIPAGAVVVSTVLADVTLNFQATHVATVSGVISGVTSGTQVVIQVNGANGSTQQKTLTLPKGGHYTLPPLVEDTYTITVTATGYTFIPVSATITIGPSNNRVIQNFKGTPIP